MRTSPSMTIQGDYRQLHLFMPPTTPDVPDEATLTERFEAFHRANPQVYRGLRRLALEVKAKGFARWSTKAAYEVLRYSALVTTGMDFKLNNDFTAFYARLLMEQEPELDGFFVTRGDA